MQNVGTKKLERTTLAADYGRAQNLNIEAKLLSVSVAHERAEGSPRVRDARTPLSG